MLGSGQIASGACIAMIALLASVRFKDKGKTRLWFIGRAKSCYVIVFINSKLQFLNKIVISG